MKYMRIKIESIHNSGNSVTATSYVDYGVISNEIDDTTGKAVEIFVPDGRAPYLLSVKFEKSPVEIKEIENALIEMLNKLKKADELIYQNAE